MRDWTISTELLCVVDCWLSSISENWDDLNNAAKVLIYLTKGWEKNHLLIRIILIRSLLSFCFSLLFTVFVFLLLLFCSCSKRKRRKSQQNEKQVEVGRRKNYTHKKYQEMPWKQIFLPFVLMHNMNNIIFSPFLLLFSSSNKITNEKWCKSV